VTDAQLATLKALVGRLLSGAPEAEARQVWHSILARLNVATAHALSEEQAGRLIGAVGDWLAGRCPPEGWERAGRPPEPAPELDDDELIRRAHMARKGIGREFARLWKGDLSLHDNDHSAADAALCRMLAFWTRKNKAQMDRLFRRSGLMRAKWDEPRGTRTYGQMTIDYACEYVKVVYTGRKPGAAAPKPQTPPASRGSAP
jgi:hypothetical protein